MSRFVTLDMISPRILVSGFFGMDTLGEEGKMIEVYISFGEIALSGEGGRWDGKSGEEKWD